MAEISRRKVDVKENEYYNSSSSDRNAGHTEGHFLVFLYFMDMSLIFRDR